MQKAAHKPGGSFQANALRGQAVLFTVLGALWTVGVGADAGVSTPDPEEPEDPDDADEVVVPPEALTSAGVAGPLACGGAALAALLCAIWPG
jgi:hypothetical protein